MNSVNGFGFAASGILVAIAIAISAWRTLGLERSLIWASTRAFVQLTLMGLVLVALLDDDTPLWWSWVWVGGMIAFATTTLMNRVFAKTAPGNIPVSKPRVAILGVTAFGLAAVVSLGTVFGLGIFDLETQTLVPVSGMMIGNSMNAAVLAARRVVAEFTENAHEIEARLALAYPSEEAAKPYLREALRTALIPQIESTKAVGFVLLPGAMVGLILAGADPATAVRVQLAVMYLILGSVAITSTVIGLGLAKQLFSADHRLLVRRRSSS